MDTNNLVNLIRKKVYLQNRVVNTIVENDIKEPLVLKTTIGDHETFIINKKGYHLAVVVLDYLSGIFFVYRTDGYIDTGKNNECYIDEEFYDLLSFPRLLRVLSNDLIGDENDQVILDNLGTNVDGENIDNTNAAIYALIDHLLNIVKESKEGIDRSGLSDQ